MEQKSAPDLLARSAASRPAWLEATPAPLTSSCTHDDEHIVCVGASSRALQEGAALTEARDAAIEALVFELGERFPNEQWRAATLLGYPDIRAKDFAKLRTAQASGSSELDAIRDRVRAGQAAVALSLGKRHAVGFESDEYWEHYSSLRAVGPHYLGFVRIRLPVGAFERLQNAYSTRYEVLGAQVVDFFPGSAWRYRDTSDGATIWSLRAGDLRNFGLAEGYVVLSVQDQATPTGESFAEIALVEFQDAKEYGGFIKLVVKTGDTPPMLYNMPFRVPRQKGDFPHRRGPRWMGDIPPHPTPKYWPNDPNQRPSQRRR